MPDLTALLAKEAIRHRVPGASMGLLVDGEVTTAHAGHADARSGRPVALDERFAVGSLTKPMVASVLSRFAAQGRLSLDDALSTHVPELQRSGWASIATVRDVMAGRSRLPLRAEWEFSGVAGDDDAVLSRFASIVAGAPASPAGWSYTNAGWSLLGRLIECLTGQVWEDAMREQLFAPLGMEQTTFTLASPAEPRALGHEWTGGRWQVVPPSTPRVFGPSGTTVLSTAADLIRFAAFLLDEPATQELRSLHADVAIHGWLDGWCLGLAQFDWAGQPVWGWDGLISGQRAILRLLPDRHAAVAILTNGSSGRDLCRSALARLMSEIFGLHVPPLRLAPASSAPADLGRYVGVYAWPDRAWTVTEDGDRLTIEGAGRTDQASAVDDRVFLIDPRDPDNPTVTFDGFDSAGRPSVLYRMLWAYHRQLED